MKRPRSRQITDDEVRSLEENAEIYMGKIARYREQFVEARP